MRRRPAAEPALLRQMAEMQNRLAEAEDTLNAIRSGAVDALVVRTPRGEQLFTLKGADQTYRALVEAMNEGAITLKNGIVSYCNNHFAEMIRMPMEKIFGAAIFELIQSDELPRLIRRLKKGAKIQGSIEAVLRAANGSRVPVLLSACRFQSEDHEAVGLVVTDITARKEAERVRRELSRGIINAQEQERQRVARELHDGVNQLLASAKYRLGSITQKRSGPYGEDIRQVGELVEKAIGEVRLISRNLRPSELDDLGLIAALRSLTHEFGRRSGMTARFKSATASCPSHMPKEVEMTLYRIAQEALNNVEKHSRAVRVELALSCNRTQALLTIYDNGRGFSRRGISGVSGWGLQNMNERAALLGGKFEALSVLKRGTKIMVRLPFGDRPRRKTRKAA
jgi:PAS domain S-box-containing protein